MGQKHWLLLPFLGSSEGHREHRHYAARQKETFSGNETFLTTHESAADFAAKSEEDIINDYNAPTRWWIVSVCRPLPVWLRSLTILSRDPVPIACRDFWSPSERFQHHRGTQLVARTRIPWLVKLIH